MQARALGSVQHDLGIASIGDGYLVRTDGIAVGVIDATPPDLRLYDEDAIAALMASITDVLLRSSDRCHWHTIALPVDITPLLETLRTAHQNAPDFHSYAILGSMIDWIDHAWSVLTHVRAIRWLITMPTTLPEQPPAGTWGELTPEAIIGHPISVEGNPREEALLRAQRMLNQLAAIGIEPQPRLASAATIRALVRIALDPIAHEHTPVRWNQPEPRIIITADPALSKRGGQLGAPISSLPMSRRMS